MLNSGAGGHPLNVTVSVSTGCPERVGVVNKSVTDKSNSFKTPVRVNRESRYPVAMVHPPAILYVEIAPDVSTSQKGTIGAHFSITFGKKVVVMDTEDKGIDSLPVESQWPF